MATAKKPAQKATAKVEPLKKGWFDADKEKAKINFQKASAISSESEVLMLMQHGQTKPVIGKAVRWDVDVSARHIDAKKGDIVYTDSNNMPVLAVRAFYPASGIEPVEKAPEKAEVSQ